MKRKNLFLIPALFLISTLCLINVSCFSGFQEKGEVTVTFSESTLRQIMARGADISAEQEDFDFDPTANMVAYYAGMTSDAQETFALYVYQDATYAVYAVSKMEAIAKDLQERYGNLTEEDYLSNPKLLEMLKNPMALYEKAIISKGSWSQSGDSISITEKKYMDLSTEELVEVQNPEVIGVISTNILTFTVISKSGYTITFYAVKNGDVSYEDEPTESAKLSVKLVAGNMSYEKTFTVYSNTKKAHVEFTDIPVGVTAKVFATVYLDEPHGGQITFAKGESDEFVINPGSNYAKIKLREYYGGDEPPSGVPEAIIEGKGLYDEHGGSNNRQYLLAFYRNGMYAVYEYDSIPKIVDIDDSDEILAVLESGLLISYGTYTSTTEKFKYTETACYDFSNRTYKKGTASGDWTLPFVTIDFATGSGVMVRFYNNGNEYENEISYSAYGSLPEQYWKTFNGGILYFNALSDGTYSIFANVYGDDLQYKENKYFAKGTWELVEAEGASASLRLIETEYYDFDSDGLVSGGNKVTVVDLSKTSFSYNGSTGIELEFNLNVEPSSYPFTFIINGFDKNDVTDLDGNECNVTLYAIKDASVMSTIKSTLANEKLSDDAKAEILVPIIEGALNYSITAFQPGINYSSHSDAPTSEVLDDGTIKWSGTGLTPLSEGTTYGVLATVYFSQNYSSGYYEFDIGYAENLTLSSDSNEVELTVSAMDIPCKIQFYHDDDYDSQYTVTTAMSEIMMFDEDNNIRESVLNELWAAAEESVNALAEKNYEYDSNSIPVCGMQNGVPFVTLYYVKVEPLDIPASGSIAKDNRSVIISMDYDSDTLYLNKGTFTFSATYPDGSELSESDTENIVWDAQLLYKGKSVNSFGEQYCEVIDNKLVLEKHMPLPSAGNYQILVTAKLPVYQNSTTTVDSSQTFDLSIGDRHIYDISDEYNDIRYAQSLHNVVITGDVTDADWEWTLDEQSSDHILQVLFSEHRKSLQKITFNGQFESPDYDAFSSSPLYDAEPKQPISFSNSVSIEFKDVASIGKNLFYGIGNLQSVKFTTTGSSFGEGNFKNCASLTSMDCTGVSTIGYETFRGNTKLTSIVLIGVTTIESYAFYGCTGLTTVTIPESVIEIGEEAFSGCENLNSVEFEVTTGWKKVIENNETLEAWEPDFTNTTNIAALLRSAEPTMPKLIRE